MAKSSPPAVKADKWLAALVLFVLVLAGAFYGIRFLTKTHPKPQANTAVPPAPLPPLIAQPVPVQGAPKLVDNPTSAAGKAIAKARDVVAAHDKLEKEQGVDSVLDTPSTTPPVPVSTRAGAALAQAEPAGVVPAPAPPEPPPEASDFFRQFVVNMRVNGVFQGDPPRAMLNGKMVHPGDLVDAKLGITFLKVEVEAKQLVFRDASGATVARHY